MQEIEAVTFGSGSVRSIQSCDPVGRDLQERSVAVGGRGGGVRPVRQQREVNFAVRSGQVVHFETLDLHLYGFRRRQQRGHDDDGSQVRWHALLQRQSRQQGRAESARDCAIDQCHGQVDSRNRPEQSEQRQVQAGDGLAGQCPQRQGETCRCECQYRADIAADADRHAAAAEPIADGDAIAHRALESAAPAADQVITRIGLAVRREGRAIDRIITDASGRYHSSSNLELRVRGAARELLDSRSVQRARREVHAGEVAGVAQRRVDQARVLEEVGPVHVRDQPHAGDDVAYRDVRGALPLMLVANQGIRRRVLRSQLILEPRERGGDARILIAQAFDDLHDERG
jgi:hypothetical protein